MNLEKIKETVEFQEIVRNMDLGRKQLIYGLSGGQKGFLLSSLVKETGKDLIIITNSQSNSEKIFREMNTYLGEDNVYHFPANPLMPGEVDFRSKDIEIERISTLHAKSTGKARVVVAQITSCLEILPHWEAINKAKIILKVDEDLSFPILEKKLIQLGYVRCGIVEKQGDFSIRGSVIDIFPSIGKKPIRLEFFGDTLESIRYFDVRTQRSSMENIKEFDLFTNTLNVLENHKKEALLLKLNNFLNQAKDSKIKQKLRQDIEKIENDIIFDELTQYNHEIYNGGQSLIDIFSDHIIVMDETPFIKKDLETWLKDYSERLKQLIEKGEVFPKIPLYYQPEEIVTKVNKSNAMHFCLLLRTLGNFKVDNTVSLPFRQAPVFAGNVELFFEEIKRLVKERFHIAIYYTKKEVMQGLKNLFVEKKLEIESKDGPLIEFKEGFLEEGFIFDRAKIACFVERQIYKGTKGRKGKSLNQGVSITDISHLDIGDYIVHINHGIGVFKGINTLEVAGGKKDYIYVQYAGNDKLYIPTDQVEVLQKFVGGEGKEPKIYSLSGNDWAKTTKKARQSIREMAQSLVYLYAKRQSSQGYQFDHDTTWQNQFEDNFPYTETVDQLKAIKEVKIDMEQPKPMDRLICGDVGYGKTEVAMRAAMKCVLDGKQVAVLVPTTILAQQHFKNFKERFQDFPVNIEVFSRFRSKKETDEGLVNLMTGVVDIAIGTHKLLQKNVKFKDLGLIIVDEEQRFGVAHKERLKELKMNVDVLTMTATPIPRTLHMSMLGIRDLSVIETPPEDRFPVQTYVLEYNEDVIATAIKREIERGGQVYFVYNRVQSIDAMAAKIQKMVPDCKIAIGHGQMAETQLEKTMLGFLDGEYDVLLSTTIIETGLDIPNVNTLIIYDADKFGLSQLYQLRGRVGRSNRVAYSYLTYHKDKVLTEVAQKRLQAIKEFTDLGSGFKIAMRDLEIRGAGNILGLEQHGFIASIGFDLYCQLLEEAIAELKGKKPKQRPLELNIEFPIDAYIPEKLMNRSLKMSFYRRISMANNLENISEIEEEMYDRFGKLPEQVANLIDMARLKIYGQKIKIKSISAKGLGYLQKPGENNYSVEIKFYPNTSLTGKELLEIYDKNKNLDFAMKNESLVIKLKKVEVNSLLPETEKLLHQLIAKAN
ncbi:transcription-repair coupling factor [Alkalicella caledoniensis]|uniref:Transcription-repair-coupling factor n=1 Tax=Alkalicella caledoniensis TaxID=2731377 RepID=A0A7G9W859_ALKCA|nr:transcription-repair coupling factor [Alkalicella caledoniensis]QNO14871.1 transcription-repair coupling factor [Alkalicella caledoniensis]